MECEAFQIFYLLLNFQTLEMFPVFPVFPVFLGKKKEKNLEESFSIRTALRVKSGFEEVLVNGLTRGRRIQYTREYRKSPCARGKKKAWHCVVLSKCTMAPCNMLRQVRHYDTAKQPKKRFRVNRITGFSRQKKRRHGAGTQEQDTINVCYPQPQPQPLSTVALE